MGRVLQARDVVLDVPVALKVVRPDLASDHRFRKLFDLEVRMAARFAHPNIVPLHDYGELPDGTPFLGLALADAGSFGALREEQLSWSELRRLVLQLLDALSHLHARDVLHRDLKPENVLLYTGADGRRHVWLADLGLANAGSQLARRKGRVEGTPGFMAPEQKLGLPREYGPWTDLFSLGVILWDLISGTLPFEPGRTPLDATLPRLTIREGISVPAGLEAILVNLLSAEPLSRYDLAADLRTELLALGEANGVVESPALQGADAVRMRPLAAAIPVAKGIDSGRTFLDPDELSEEVARAFQFGVPVWNRPRPSALPDHPVSEQGLGATARASLALFALRELPMVGRADERQQLWSLATDVVRNGRSRVAIVVGEAGSGKTILVESISRALQEGGWAETTAMSWQQPAGPDDGYAGSAKAMLRPWNETRASLEARLARRLARERGQLDEKVREEASTLARWCGLENPGEEPVAIGYGLREVYRHLDARSWRGLSCLILDQTHWAVEDGDGLAIAESVLQNAHDGLDRRWLVMATVRSEELSGNPALAERIDHLVALGAMRVDLPRLDRAGTEALLQEMLSLAPSLSEKVARRCEGNPLFARQLLQEWAVRGWLVDTGALKFGLAPGVDADAVLPADAEALFRARLEGLAASSGDRNGFIDAVHLSALAGQSVPLGLFKTLVDPDLFGFILGCGVWKERQGGVAFDHNLLHQAAASQAEARSDVIELHGRVSDAWAKYGEQSGAEVALEVGRHAALAGNWAVALDKLLRAAEHAWRRGRTRELEQAASLAVEAAQHQSDLIPRGWARLWKGRSWQMAGAATEAMPEFSLSREAFREGGFVDGASEAAVGMGWCARMSGQLPESERLYVEAMKQAKEHKNVPIEAAAIAGLAWVEQQKRNFQGADILFTRVLNRCNQLGDRRGSAEAAFGQALVARRKGAFDEAEDLYVEAEAGFEEGDDRLGVARALQGRGVVQRQRLFLEDAERLFREAMTIAEELGATDLLMEGRFGLAELARIRGEFERSRQLYEVYLRWAERAQLLEPMVLGRLGLAQVALMQGELGPMYEHSVAASETLNKVPGHWLWAMYRLVVAALLAYRGDEQGTYKWIWSASELGLRDTVDHDIAYLVTAIVRVAHQFHWTNVMKVAESLAATQWERLRLPEEAAEVARLAAEMRDLS